MQWWRSHSGIGARLALFALLIQLALSFGHVHPLRADGPSAGAPIAAGVEPGTTDQDHSGDYCATCAILALLTGAQIAAAPAVALPASHTEAAAPIFAAAVRLIARHDSFQSRAPPNS